MKRMFSSLFFAVIALMFLASPAALSATGCDNYFVNHETAVKVCVGETQLQSQVVLQHALYQAPALPSAPRHYQTLKPQTLYMDHVRVTGSRSMVYNPIGGRRMPMDSVRVDRVLQ